MNDVPAHPELEQKKRFAVELLKNPLEPFVVACSIFGDDTGRALEASHRWPRDPIVMEYMREATIELGDMHFLPTKAETARAAFTMSSDPKVHIEDRLKALRLYADIRGFIDKQPNNTNVNILTTDKVMLVKDHGAEELWEQSLVDQQQRLIDDASKPRLN